MSDKRPKAVKVGDRIELEGPTRSGLASLPDGTVVTCRNAYTVQHVGRHVIDGVEYNATEPAKRKPAEPADPADQADPKD